MVHQAADRLDGGAFAGSYVDKQTFLNAVEQLGPRATMKEANYLLFGERRKGSGWPASYLRAYGIPSNIAKTIDTVAVDVGGCTHSSVRSTPLRGWRDYHTCYFCGCWSHLTARTSTGSTPTSTGSRARSHVGVSGEGPVLASVPWYSQVFALAKQAGRNAGSTAERAAAELVTNDPHYQGRRLVNTAIEGAEELQ